MESLYLSKVVNVIKPPKAEIFIFLDNKKMRSEAKARARASVIVARATPKFKGTQMREQQLNEMIEKKVKEATEVCEGNQSSEECKVAWDEVEEISQAKADFRLKLEKQDPLEFFCQDNPDTDECRIYDD